MAATSDEEMDSLLSSFDQIYHDVKTGINHIQSLQSNCDAQVKKREALLVTACSLKADNERLTKLYTESINKLADQLECRTYCQRLKEELERVRDEYLKKENKYRNSVESLKQDCAAKIKEFETKMKGFLIQKAADEATIRQLNEDLSAHKIHLECLTSKLGLVEFDVESRYHYEVQGLKDCLLIEQEEKNELNKKLQNFEKELLISRTKLAEHQRDLTLNRQVEALKQKIMKLRKENEVLKRQLRGLKED
ncbi:protein At-4/1 isoform X4 [Diospyros lotus]|uniref:protein At-4/1 isoform X4 n=1 Tax=Diospyros lotus TaxID=55363 RepID=UPI00224D9E63|nr:protein At-4/1 isoform X4 [Diospyros lotus]